MAKIARIMITTLQNELKQKSPSKVMAEIGHYSMMGMAQGIKDGSKMVVSALEDAAGSAVSSMQKSLGGLSSLVAEHIDPNPVITPILDLSTIQSQAGDLAALTANAPVSYGQASAISAMQQPATTDEIAGAVSGTNIKFEQNNYSPESLSEIEIYRQTNNVLSQLKTAAGLA
jgi:hypothetical protein